MNIVHARRSGDKQFYVDAFSFFSLSFIAKEGGRLELDDVLSNALVAVAIVGAGKIGLSAEGLRNTIR